MILFYKIITFLIYPLLVLLIYLRKLLKKEDPFRYKEKIFRSYFKVNKIDNLNLLWFHAASVGELNSVMPIIKEINSNYKNIQFLITTVTLSSGNLIKEEIKDFDNMYHRFLPIDVDFLIKDFLKLWKPSALFLVDSEIWPNLIINVKSFKIPLAIINARITSKSFKRWMFFPKVSKKIFSNFDLCLASNIETKNYLSKLSVKNVSYTGNIKLINNIDYNKIISSDKDSFLKERFWIAISTHRGEEDFCLKTHLILKRKHKGIKFLIAPRHIERSKEIGRLCQKHRMSFQVLGKNDDILENKEIIIINFFGGLPRFLKHANSVFMGKSLLKRLEKVGGQNPIDAARMGCRIYHGPFVYNFEEIYKILNENNISFQIKSCEDLSKNLLEDFKNFHKDTQKNSYLLDNLGKKTFNDTMKNINSFLKNEIK